MVSNPVWRDQREAKLEPLHERLAQAVDGLVPGEDWVRAKTFAARFRSRSPNTLLIYAQHAERFAAGSVTEPLPSCVAGFRQWESLGRSVPKDQRGYMIQAPVLKRLASATPSEPDPWRARGYTEKAKPSETTRMRTRPPNQKLGNSRQDVFQTTGAPVPERPGPKLLEDQSPEGLWNGLAGLIGADWFTLQEVPDAASIGGANGITNYFDSTVSIRSDLGNAAQAEALGHQLAHVRMHNPDGEGFSRHCEIGDVEAESVAMMVGSAHGMPTDSCIVPDVSGWATTVKGKTLADVVQATGERDRATALIILNALDTAQVGAGDPPGLDPSSLPQKPSKLTPSQAVAGVKAAPLAGRSRAVGA